MWGQGRAVSEEDILGRDLSEVRKKTMNKMEEMARVVTSFIFPGSI